MRGMTAVPGWVRVLGAGKRVSFAAFGRDAGQKPGAPSSALGGMGVVPGWVRVLGVGRRVSFAAFGHDAGQKPGAPSLAASGGMGAVPGWIRVLGAGKCVSFAAFGRDAGQKPGAPLPASRNGSKGRRHSIGRKNKWQRTFGSLPAISGESVKGGYPLSQSATTESELAAARRPRRAREFRFPSQERLGVGSPDPSPSCSGVSVRLSPHFGNPARSAGRSARGACPFSLCQ